MRRRATHGHFLWRNKAVEYLVVILCFLTFQILIGRLVTLNRTPCLGKLAARNNIIAANTVGGPSSHEYRIFVFAYARPDGVKKTLNSLLESDYSKAPVGSLNLEVFVDFRRHDSLQMQQNQSGILQFLRTLKWPYGQYKIHQRLKNAGLRLSIMEAWQPTSDREVAAFFEDDVVVSPYWFSWVYDALAHYAPVGSQGAIETEPRFIGFGLFRPIVDEISRRRVHVKNDYAPFLLQQPCSWGAVYLPGPWRRFRELFERERNRDPTVKRPEWAVNPVSNSWSYKSSWKKYLIYYMYWNGWYMMYPNLPEKLVLSTSLLLPGEHPTPPKKLFLLEVLRKEHLEKDFVKESLVKFASMKDMQVYDMMFNKTRNVDDLIPKADEV
ncbi:hypothetical protein MOQ_000363 [Trypanosoma cruzi marinkellei]|uniref:Uncharacterized protein n=1 Tax=Trypanosoma cruzi marinkellei TaxID=85056 RepID=K2NJ34_TRYCR|nr:hypothetical protein MOQ_000363 [Trypanosoma cruzi marinkellei]